MRRVTEYEAKRSQKLLSKLQVGLNRRIIQGFCARGGARMVSHLSSGLKLVLLLHIYYYYFLDLISMTSYLKIILVLVFSSQGWIKCMVSSNFFHLSGSQRVIDISPTKQRQFFEIIVMLLLLAPSSGTLLYSSPCLNGAEAWYWVGGDPLYAAVFCLSSCHGHICLI